jgi:hypothetical protein
MLIRPDIISSATVPPSVRRRRRNAALTMWSVFLTCVAMLAWASYRMWEISQ